MASEKKRLDINPEEINPLEDAASPTPPPVLGAVDESKKIGGDQLGMYEAPAPGKRVKESKDEDVDLSKLTYSQAFQSALGAEQKLLLTVPVRKPSNMTWWRAHPSPDYRGDYSLLEVKDSREIYFVNPLLAQALAKWSRPYRLITCITSEGNTFLLPIRLPGLDGKCMAWWDSLEDAADQAVETWVNISSNMQNGAYDVALKPDGVFIPDPAWPKETFRELMALGFKRKTIMTKDHPLVERLFTGKGA